MIVKTKSGDVTVQAVASANIRKSGKTYPALKFVFHSGATETDVNYLTSGEIVVGETTYEGYTTLGEIAVTVGKITSAETERDNAVEILRVLTGDGAITPTEAAAQREIIETAVQSLDDATALSAIALFPAWEVGAAYEVDTRVRYGGKLYRILTAHTSQGDWTPDVAPSLFTVVDAEHAGTADDPVPYDGNMALENGKYYTQDGVTYLCNRDTVNPVYNALSELVGLYVEVV